MTLLHVVYALAVGGLITAAATLADAALRGLGRPGRAVWMVALVATVTAPFWGPENSSRNAPAAPSPAVAGAVVAGTPPAAPTVAERLEALARVRVPGLVLGWLALALAGSIGVGIGMLRLERRAGSWPRATVEGEEVRVSPEFGPAVIGLRHPRTVLPGWMLSLPRRDLRLVIQHERSHRDAGDGALLAAGLVLAVLCFWNPWVWVQFRRLRDATEVDCDRRLLSEGVSAPAYARVLVAVRLRGTPAGGAIAGLVESPSSLERRLKTMNAFPWSRPRVAVTALAAVALVAVACETPAPSAIETAAEAEVAASEVVRGELVEREVPVDVSSTLRLRAPEGEPLVVIDGEASFGDVSEVVAGLHAENIERIEVIKGEAAIAVYGERGANGVVSIFTKDGTGEIELRPDASLELHYQEVPVAVGSLKRVPNRDGGGR